MRQGRSNRRHLNRTIRTTTPKTRRDTFSDEAWKLIGALLVVAFAFAFAFAFSAVGASAALAAEPEYRVNTKCCPAKRKWQAKQTEYRL